MSIETKKSQVVNAQTLIATVDIGKSRNTGYCRCPGGQEIRVFEFGNNAQGLNKFWSTINRAKELYGLQKIVVGFESTGVYGQPLINFLHQKGDVKLVQVNPMHTKRVKELRDNSPLKTDYKDPKVIADIICLGHYLTVIMPEGVAADLRSLTQARERALQERTRLSNQLGSLVFSVFPELGEILVDLRGVTCRRLLESYPLPEDIVTLGLDGLSDFIGKSSRRRLGREKAREIYDAAGASAGASAGSRYKARDIRQLVADINRQTEYIRETEDLMQESLAELPEGRALLSMKGLGVVTVAGLVGEVADFAKFRTCTEIEKLAGLNLYEISSGKYKSGLHISRKGRALMRKLLYFAALSTVRQGGIMHDYYSACLGRGMPRSKALVAVSRKLLRIMFALARDKSLYREDYSGRSVVLSRAA